MARKVLICISILLCLLAACKSGNEINAIRDRGELRVGVKVDVPNFGYINPDTNELEGLEIDIANIVVKELLGDECIVSFISVGSAQTRAVMLDNGEVDIAIATFTITPEREEQFIFSRSYFTDELGCLVRADSGINTMKDLDGRIVGVLRSSTSGAAFESECQVLKIMVTVLEFSNYPEIAAELENGNIDAFITDKSILYGYINDTYTLLDEGFNPQRYGIGVKLGNNELASQVDSILSTMEQNGQLAALLDKWGLTNTQDAK